MTMILLIILMLPLAGFLVLGGGFRSIPKRVGAVIGTNTILGAFLLSIALFYFHQHLSPSMHQPKGSFVFSLFEWIQAGNLRIPFEFIVDPLTLLMLLVVTGVGYLIHLYSVGYMNDDPGFNRFFAYMNLFVFFMLLLVTAGSFPIMFIGWEGVGLCSYLLIGFWFRNQEYNNAAKKAFIMNRIGDLGFLVGMFLIYTTFGSLSFLPVFAKAGAMPAGTPVLTAITLLLFVGAVGKSAQIPLYTWLPDAMAGPTPVSALIHAATMVTAGVYMVARSGALYALAPFTLTVIAVTGIATALFAAVIALFQNDIKKILAYSTISQLGYMFAALGAGGFTGAVFHLTTHAFFKALLFLGAGSVIHAMGGEQDIRRMGGLRKKMPITAFTFLAGTLALAGLPPLSGFFSKDEILLALFGRSPLMWGFAAAGALLSALYMFRMLFLAFFGRFRGTDEQDHHLHESPGVMTFPLVILALAAVAGGLLNLPGWTGTEGKLAGFLDPVFSVFTSSSVTHHLSPSTEWILMGVTLAAIVAMIAIAWRRYGRGEEEPATEVTPGALRRLAEEKFRIDELYDRVVIRLLLWLSRFLHDTIDRRGIDRAVNGAGAAVVRAGNTFRFIQTGNVGFYMFIMILGILAILVTNILL